MSRAKNLSLVVLCIVAVIIVSCNEESGVHTTGRIEYIDLEGGFYGIIGDDGVKYDPVNLSSDFKQDSLRVRFEGKILTDQASFHMWGTLIELTKIERLN